MKESCWTRPWACGDNLTCIARDHIGVAASSQLPAGGQHDVLSRLYTTMRI